MSALSVRDFREAQANIVRLAERELMAFFATLDPENPLAVVRALELFMPELIQAYGEIGAAVAADFYEELRADNPRIRSAYQTRLADAIPMEASRISTKWAVGPLFQQTADVSATISNLTEFMDRQIKRQGRNTIIENTLRDPAQARFARVPSGTDTCSYCLMLASRGAIYYSEAAAEAGKFHGKCDCTPTPVWDDNDYDRLKADEGYDPDKLYDRWQEALEAEKAAKAAKAQ